jgi:hypothetical protein
LTTTVQSAQHGSSWRRHALGVIAIAFLAAAVVQGYRLGFAAMQESVSASICLRVGLVLGAAWLAHPQLRQIGQKYPPWMIAATGFGILVLLVQPKAFRLLLPILVLLVALQYVSRFFRPRRK